MKPLPPLQPGDCLLYRPSNLLDWLVCIKTGSRISHVEVYWGDSPNGEHGYLPGEQTAIAARPFKGVDIHPLRIKNLAFVRRPPATFVLRKALARYTVGKKYDWLGLFTFFLAVRRGNNQRFFCSELATALYRDGVFQPFNPGVRADHISPADFHIAGTFTTIWSSEY